MTSTVELTADEIIATLNHSSLPTLVIEGEDDVIIFRRLEEQADNLTLSVLPVGGRNNVLALHQRRGEIRSGQPIAFVADLDLWVFSAVPAEYISESLLFTDGYSIENDAFRDVDCEKLLRPNEKSAFHDDLKIYAEWFALAISRCSGGMDFLDMHPNRILDDQSERQRMMALRSSEQYPHELYANIVSGYQKLMRGKSLFELFQRRMSKSRPARHNRKSLLEMAAVKPGPLIQRLFDGATRMLVT